MSAREGSSGHIPSFRPIGREQKDFVRSMCENPLTVCRSRSYGNGKTYCAIGHASMLLAAGSVERVVFVRDTTIMADRLGYMPGGPSEKLASSVKFAKSYFLKFLGDFSKTSQIEYRDAADIAGATFDNSFMIFDEASNSSLEDLEMFIGRAGQNTKCCILGTDRQIKRGSGFPVLWDRLGRSRHVGLIELRKILRNDWVGEVLACLESEEQD